MSYPEPGDPLDPSDHPATNMPQATQHYAGDVVKMPRTMGQWGNGALGQMKNTDTDRTGSSTTNVTPIRPPVQIK